MVEAKMKVFSKSADFLFQLKNYSKKKIYLEFQSECADDLEFIEQIGNSIGQLRHVSEISLMFQKNTNLKQEGWKFLFKGLEQLNQLEDLEVQIGEQCFLEDQGLILLIYAISSLVNLKKLTIAVENVNFISSSCVKNIFDYLKHFPQLVELKVQILEYQNDISEEKTNIWSGIYSLKEIQSLDLSLSLQYNNEKDIDEFFQALLSLKNLTKLALNLDYNQQEFDFIEKLTFNLSQITQLKELSLGFNGKLKEKSDFQQVFTFFRKLTNLEKIDLTKSIGNSLFVALNDQYYESLSYLPHLRDLKIEISPFYNQKKEFQEKRTNCLSNKKNLRNLSFVSLEVNINNQDCINLNKAFQNNKFIESLQISFSIIQKEHLCFQLFESLCSLQLLKQLDIQFTIDYSNINNLNYLISGIGNIKSLQNLKIKLSSPPIPNQNKQQQLVLQDLKYLNLNSFEFHLDAVILGKEFQQLGLVLQNQKQLQKLKIVIGFKQYQAFFFIGNQQQQQNQIQIEKIEDFIEGIKSLQNLKELQYGIRHSVNTQILNPIFESLKYLTNLEKFELLEDKDYEDSQLGLLTISLSRLNKLKLLKLQKIKQAGQESFKNQIQNISNLNNLQYLELTNFIPQLSNTKIGVEKVFLNLTQLLSLQLSIQITKNSELLFEDIINGIGKLNKLELLKINFGSYEFTETGSYHFSQACSGLESLIDLGISTFAIDDNITLNGVKFLREGFLKLKKLKIFESNFYIPTLEFSKIVEGFFTNKSLRNLKIRVETSEKPSTQDDIKKELFIDQKTDIQQKINHNLTKMISFFDFTLREQIFDISKFYENFINLQNLNHLQLLQNWYINQNSKQYVEFSPIFKNLACAFQQFKKLQHLKIELKNCKFDFEEIPIQNMKYLTNLNWLEFKIHFCQLQSEHMLFDQFKYLNRLQYLNIYIRDCQFGRKAAISLGNSFMHLKMVQKLYLILSEGCQIESEGTAEIGIGLGYLKNLSSIQIYFSDSCKINEIGAIKLGEGINKLFALKVLTLNICNNNNITKKAGVCLVSSLKKKKYLESIFLMIQKESNEQGQEFIDELSNFFDESKLIKNAYLEVSFNEQLLFCPDQLKNFVSQASGFKINLQMSNNNSQLKTDTTIQSEQGQLKFIFTYDTSLTEYTPKFELELLQKIEKNQNIFLDFHLSQNDICNNQFIRVSEQIEQLQTRNLSIQFEFYHFSQNYLDEIIFPALKNKELLHFSLILKQEENQEINNEVFTQIGQHLCQLNLLTLELNFNDMSQQNLFSDKYSLVLKELWNFKTLNGLSLSFPNSRISKLKRNMKYIQRIVTFSTNQMTFY